MQKKEDRIEKYLVTFDEKLLRELRKEIIDNCSLIEHYEYDGTRDPSNTEDSEIRNLSCKFVEREESRDSLHYPDKDVYHYSYDKYVYPKFISYIDNFLKGDIQLLSKMPETTNVVKELKLRINTLSEELDAIDNLDIKNKKWKLEQIERRVNQLKLNENQVSTDNYFQKFNDLITLILVDTITIEEIARVDSFYEKETKYTRKLCRKKEN